MSETFKERIGVGRPSHIGRRHGGPGTTKTTTVARDDAPGVAGTQTEHWSGRVDACATNPSYTVNPNLKARRPDGIDH